LNESLLLKSAYTNILNGYSSVHSSTLGKIYIKHLNSFDFCELERLTETYEQKAIEQTIPTEAQKLEYLISLGLWSNEKDAEISNKELFVKNAQITRSKFIRQIDIDSMDRQISAELVDLSCLKDRRVELMGLTIEVFVKQKVDQSFVFLSLFSDVECKNPLFTFEDFQELEIEELQDLYFLFEGVITSLSELNINKITLQDFFLSAFCLCDDNPFTFFGKPVIELTNYQCDIFRSAKYFKSILQEHPDLSETIRRDPEKLIEYHKSSESAKEILDKGKDADGTFIMGSKKDLQRAGIQEHEMGKDMSKLAKEQGSNKLTFKQLIEKDHGKDYYKWK